MIHAEHLSKRYGSHYALDDVSFSIGEGEIVGLLGANGAGKSTTMNIMTGYLSATAGRVLVDGVDILDDPVGVKKKIGYLPEQPPLYSEMTVKEYLDFVYDLKGVEFPKEAHLAEVMEVTHVADVRHKLISLADHDGILLGTPHHNALDEGLTADHGLEFLAAGLRFFVLHSVPSFIRRQAVSR